jgi:RHS repeat-associated protein
MRLIMRCFSALSFCLVISTTAIQAQDLPDVAQGLQPYASYHGGGLDVVSMLNGGLTVRIPLVSYPQKGSLTLSYSVIFNSFGFQDIARCIAADNPGGPIATIPLHTGCTNNIKPIPTGLPGIFPLGPRLIADQQLGSGGSSAPESDQNPQPPIDARFYVISSDNSEHPLGAASDGYRSVDGSGYLFVPASAPSSSNGNIGEGENLYPGDTNILMGSAPGTITDSHGLVYTSTGITDPDGNTINLPNFVGGGASLPVTDSVGRNIPALVSGNVGNCPTLSGAQYQPLSSALLWNPPGPGGTVPYLFCYANVNIYTHYVIGSTANGNSEYINTVSMLQSIVLPNGTFWGFIYDSNNPNSDPTPSLSNQNTGLGQLLTLIYPTGGSVNYTYGVFEGFCNTQRSSGLVPDAVLAYPQQVETRTEMDAQGNTLGAWSYTYPPSSSGAFTGSISSVAGDFTVTYFSSDGTPCGYVDAGQAVYQGGSASGTPLKSTQTTYNQVLAPGLPYASASRPTQTTTTLNDGSVSSTQTSYAPGINFYTLVCTSQGLNCAPGAATSLPVGGPVLTAFTDYSGAVLKQEKTTYQWQQPNPNYFAANLLAIPYKTEIDDASGSPVAYTTYTYDEPTYSPGGKRGHATTTTSYLNTGPSPITHTGWYSSGEKAYTIDADGHTNNNGHTNDYQYNQCNGSVLTDTYNALNQHISGTYDCNTGLLTSYTDANSNTSSFTYDGMRRILTASYPDGGSTTFNYVDSQNTVTRTIAATPDPSLTTTVIFDALGREIHRIMSDSPQSDTIDTTYDLDGRVYSVSNPYRSTSDPTYGLTTYIYDALGRKTLETEADGTSQLDWLYSGPTTTSTDEDGNSWARTYDSLGRLTTVVEPTALTTTYIYDPMGDLTNVNQFGVAKVDNPRLRSFVYDSLSRLITANNPETGTICYGQWNAGSCSNGYDANGNLQAKTDARNITTSYSYDSLNRVTSKTYSDSTPPANYYYDYTTLNRIGRLSVATVGGANVYSLYAYSYDQMGRPLTKVFQFPNATGNGLNSSVGSAGDTYDLAGHVKFTDTGAGVTGSFTRDPAGHVINVNSNLGVPLFVNATYSPLGGLASRLQANGLTETRSYDNRGRQTSTTLSASGSSVGYSVATGYDPVGNVTSVNDSVNGNWTYVYDPLNRLHQAFSSAGLDLDWEYDSFGNRLSQTPSGTGSAPQVSFPFTGNNNRADVSSGIAYDAAGNVLVDNLGQVYTYDAEERISSVTPYLGGTVTYQYDSEGNLVYENGGGTQVFLRNAAGQPVLIYPATGTSAPYQNISAYVDGELIGTLNNGAFYWAGKDTVGTKRFSSTFGNGDVPYAAETFTSLPFGDALSSIGISPLHFTGKERDAESGLDYFGARYYASSMGRFTSPDPMLIMRQKMTDPQQWNMYSYVRNNPLKMVDTNGKWPTEIHNQIIDRAFPGLSAHQRDILKSSSAGMDHCSTCQLESNSFQHSMRAPGQDPGQAKQQSADFVHTEEHLAQDVQATNGRNTNGNPTPSSTSDIKDGSLSLFGNAAHTVADGTSPAHVDAQGNPLPWNPTSPSGVEAHEAAESTITPEQMNNAVTALQGAFQTTYGQAAAQQAATPPQPQKDKQPQ